jgi:putative ABC transport system permease protein
MRSIALAFRLAGRELRGGVRGLRIVLACLALGVGAIAAVGTLKEGINRGLATDGARILGGDIDIQGGSQPAPAALGEWLQARGARISAVVTMRSMLVAASGERLLVELKAVDTAWPLIGEAVFNPAGISLGEQDGHFGMAAEAMVLERLGVKPGDVLKLGNASLQMRGAVAVEPDRVASPSIFGPRVLIPMAALASTDLVRPGAIAEYHLRAALPPGTDLPVLVAQLRKQFGDQGWRIRDRSNAAPAVAQFIERTSLFMTLVGLTSLLVGGIGVANGVRAWLDGRARTIATLRCLGASARMVFGVALIQVMALSALGVLAGLVLGAALPVAAGSLLRDILPVPPVVGIFPVPLALAGCYGLLTAAAFALWPLGRAMRIPGAALFRDPLLPAGVPMRGWLLAGNALLAAILVGLTVVTADDPIFALWFCGGALATLALFRAGGTVLMRLARLARPRVVWLRLGVGNLHRPGAPTPLLLVSLGLGLSTLAAVALIQGNVARQVNEQLPANAPSFFFIDIQNDQLQRFRDILASRPEVREVREVPSLRARIVSVNGVPADQMHVTPDSAWALRGDRGLTYANAMPDGTRLTAGAWWPANYDGPPLVSFDANIARGWGVGLGDTIRVNVLGRDIDLRIASLRDIAWRSMGLNFSLLASPGLLERAPHAHIATVRVDKAGEAGLLRAVTDALPNVSGINVTDVLRAVSDLLGQIGAALTATGSLTLAAGALVLAGAVAAGQRARIRDAVVLKTLGATRSQIRAAWMVEFGIIGAASGLIAAAVGTAASWGVVAFVMRTDWAFLPGTLAITVAACVLLMLFFGFAGTEAALRAKAAPLLRND